MTHNHGTYAGYQRHKRAGEPPCQPCRDANSEYTRQRRGRIKREPAPCGTKAARARHKRNKESCATCEEIKETTAVQAAKKSGATRRTTPEKPATPQRKAPSRDVGTTAWMYGPSPVTDPRVARKAAATVARLAPADDVPAILAALGIAQDAA